MKTLKFLLWLLIISILILPAFQRKFHPVSSKALKGVYETTPVPLFHDSSWLRGDYQDQYRKNIEDFAGFRNYMVRLFNQIDFTLFSVPHAGKIVAGKKNYLFGTEYIESWLGQNFAGKCSHESHPRPLRPLILQRQLV